MGLLTVLFLAGLATWVATSTIVEAEIFRDVREGFAKLYDKKPNWLTYKLRYLVQCHMCTGIWVAAIVALMVPSFVSGGFLGWGITALAIKGIAHSFLVAQKFLEGLTDMAKREPEYLEPITYEFNSHIDEVRSMMAQEKMRNNNVGWPD